MDVVGEALAIWFDGAGGRSAVEADITTPTDVDAVETLVVAVLDACRAEAPDTTAPLVATIARTYLREGISRAMNVLGAVVAHRRAQLSVGGEAINLTASVSAADPAEHRATAVRHARLANDFLAATAQHDQLGLDNVLNDLQTDDVEPVLSLLVTYAGDLLDPAVGVLPQVEAALGRQLCPTQP